MEYSVPNKAPSTSRMGSSLLLFRSVANLSVQSADSTLQGVIRRE
jgi:hypothetical protein